VQSQLKLWKNSHEQILTRNQLNWLVARFEIFILPRQERMNYFWKQFMAMFVNFIQGISLNKIAAKSNCFPFYYKGYVMSLSLLATSTLGWCI
jgi:hypothetical protein